MMSVEAGGGGAARCVGWMHGVIGRMGGWTWKSEVGAGGIGACEDRRALLPSTIGAVIAL